MLRETEITESVSPATGLEYIDMGFVLSCLEVPSYSGHELRMREFIILWARRHGVGFDVDKSGNVYLTKGVLGEGEYYPCVTSHMDTVHFGQKDNAEVGVPITLKIETKGGSTKVSAPGVGIGADDKCGICIALTLVEKFDKMKACFFVEEEIGCKGSNKLNARWFDDVGYVIGWDSPDLNRAAWKCGGVKLFNYDFYERHLRETCGRWGLTKFYSEPITDVMNIRSLTGVICMNFGNGGYRAHNTDEYCVLEDMDHATGMGADLVRSLGMERFEMEDSYAVVQDVKNVWYWVGEDGVWHSEEVKDDDALLAELGDGSKFSYKGLGVKKLSDKCVRYIMATYEEYISNLESDVTDALTEAYGGDRARAEMKVRDIFKRGISI